MVVVIIASFIGLLFILLALLTFARDLLASFLDSIVGLFRRILHKDIAPRTSSDRQTIHSHKRKRSKVVQDSDGEYVDFEEVKK